MSKILVTTDFSSNSKAGIKFAAQLAATTGASLVFHNVIEVFKPTSWSDKKYKVFVEHETSQAEARMKKFVADALRGEKLPLSDYSYISEMCDTKVIRTILNRAKKEHAALICLSTRGAGGVKKLFGTVASGLITYSEIPLMVVPSSYKPKPITKLFYASDFSMLKSELAKVIDFAGDVDAKVVTYHYDYMLHVPENRSRLERIIKKHEDSGVTFVLKKQNIEYSISQHLEDDIKKEKASIVILFTKQNRNWFDRLFSRHESATMAFNAQVPLLIFRKDIQKTRKSTKTRK